MKKLCFLLFCLVVLVTMVGCQGEPDETTLSSSVDSTEAGATTTTETTQEKTKRIVQYGFSATEGAKFPVGIAYDIENSANLYTETVSFTLFYGAVTNRDGLSDENKTEFAYRISGEETFHSLLTLSNMEIEDYRIIDGVVTYPKSQKVNIACNHLQGAIGTVEFWTRQCDAEGNPLDEGWTIVGIVHYSTADNIVYFYTPEQMTAFGKAFHEFQKEWNENN